jgi:predicted nucleic acid-binding protein
VVDQPERNARKVIAADTSSLRRYWSDTRDRDTDMIDRAFVSGEIVIAPAVLTEMLSDPVEGRRFSDHLASIPVLSVMDGHFERAGLLRAAMIRGGFKPSVEKCLIAQSCIDHDVPLITHDRDFRHFVKAGLELL